MLSEGRCGPEGAAEPVTHTTVGKKGSALTARLFCSWSSPLIWGTLAPLEESTTNSVQLTVPAVGLVEKTRWLRPGAFSIMLEGAPVSRNRVVVPLTALTASWRLLVWGKSTSAGMLVLIAVHWNPLVLLENWPRKTPTPITPA